MALKRNKDTAESRRYWAMIDKVVAEVEAWPAWKRGECANPPDAVVQKQAARGAVRAAQGERGK